MQALHSLQIAMTVQTVFLTNPASGRKGLAAQLDQWVAQAYHDASDTVMIVPIEFPRLAQQLDELEAQGVRNFYAVGGDGTVNAVGALLVHKPVNFGVIPTGSGNGFARNLGFSTKPALALRQTREARPLPVDTATLNDQVFLNIAGVGLAAEVAHAYARTRKRGFFPYIKKSAQQFLHYKAQPYELLLDGNSVPLPDMLGIEVANGRQWGYEAQAAPIASMRDGLLDIVLIRSIPLYAIPDVVRRLFTGRFARSNRVETRQAAHIVIRRSADGPAQIDGEAIDSPAEITIKIQPKSLNLLIPNTLTDEKVRSL
ncbi:MAG: diacylglycerol kinase family protein [Bacteroidia bacterium]